MASGRAFGVAFFKLPDKTKKRISQLGSTAGFATEYFLQR